MTRLGIAAGWAFLIALTLFIVIVYSGCAKTIPPCANPTSEYDGGWCTSGTRAGKDFMWCTPSKSLCQFAVSRATAFNEVARLGIETLSPCTQADVTMVVKKDE